MRAGDLLEKKMRSEPVALNQGLARIREAGPGKRALAAGLTLLELLVAMAIAGMILAISFPSVTRGLDGVRLQSSARRVAAFINLARAQADRDQTPVELRIDPAANRFLALSAAGNWGRDLALESGVKITNILPAASAGAFSLDPRSFVLLPNTPAPRFQVRLTSEMGRTLTVAVDPLTGVPQIDGAAR